MYSVYQSVHINQETIMHTHVYHLTYMDVLHPGVLSSMTVQGTGSLHPLSSYMKVQ
jgi:hypothetical protein